MRSIEEARQVEQNIAYHYYGRTPALQQGVGRRYARTARASSRRRTASRRRICARSVTKTFHVLPFFHDHNMTVPSRHIANDELWKHSREASFGSYSVSKHYPPARHATERIAFTFSGPTGITVKAAIPVEAIFPERTDDTDADALISSALKPPCH